MIGYYVHHVGLGHLHRARVLADELTSAGETVTGLSSLPRPDRWAGAWVDLPRDDGDGQPASSTAGGRLHWAPLGHDGLRSRTARVSAWIEEAVPDTMVIDVSVEMVLLARLHGIRVVSAVLPGRRGDQAHRLGFGVADELVAFWPPEAESMLRGVPDDVTDRLHTVGALSRFPPRVVSPRPTGRRVVVMLGAGGHDVTADDLARTLEQTPGWSWTVLGGGLGPWLDDPREALADADVVVTHAGQNSLAEVAAARRPAVVVPQQRPHDEQLTTADVLHDGAWPVAVLDAWPPTGWDHLLERAAASDGWAWSRWCDGGAARRFAQVVTGRLVGVGGGS